MVISLHFVPLGLDCTEAMESLATKPMLDYIKSQHLRGAVAFLALYNIKWLDPGKNSLSHLPTLQKLLILSFEKASTVCVSVKNSETWLRNTPTGLLYA